MNELLLEREAGEELATDARRERADPPQTGVAIAEVWFIIGRLDGSEYRVARVDRLVATIGPDYRAWWLYPAEAFDSAQAATLALCDILDPQGWRQKPVKAAILVEETAALPLARLQPDQRDAFASALDFFVQRILTPFQDSSVYERYQEADQEAGQAWSTADFVYGLDLLLTLQALLEANNGQPIILVRDFEPGADSGGDSGALSSGIV